MNKKDILNKIKSLEGLNQDERAYLVNLVNTKKKYGLVWEDKPEDVEEQLRTKLPVLQEVKERAIVSDTEEQQNPNHILIEGDNLHALTALTFTHENKIDLIYIDPPYNTGEKDFRYNDSYVDKEDAYRHSKWLSFMEKRLRIAKTLLSETGVMICHIDENEYDNLSILTKEIFSEQNNLGTIVWNKKNPKGDAKGVANMHEYILCFARNRKEFLNLNNTLLKDKENASLMINKAKRLYSKIGKIEIPKEIKDVLKPFNFSKDILKQFEIEYDIELVNKEFKAWLQNQDFSKGEKMYKYIDNEGFVYRGVSMSWPNKQTAPEDYFIPLKHPITNKDCPLPNRGWRNPSATMKKLLGNKEPIKNPDGSFLQGEILFGENEKKQPERKYKLIENLKENTSSVLNYGGSDDTLLNKLDINFPYVKPINVAKYLIESIHPNPNIILDFFAGTGSVLHATLEINKQDDNKITCFLATNNEDNIAEDCYIRNKSVINGEIDNENSNENHSNNNLRYYKTAFVDREPSLQNKRQLTQLATELLCIKEDCYTEVKHQLSMNPKQAQIFTNNNGKYLVAIYHSRNQLQVQEQIITWVESLTHTTEKVRLYAFSPEKEVLAEEFYEVIEKVEVVPLPEAIYNAYLSTIKALKLDKKQVYNNHIAEA